MSPLHQIPNDGVSISREPIVFGREGDLQTMPGFVPEKFDRHSVLSIGGLRFSPQVNNVAAHVPTESAAFIQFDGATRYSVDNGRRHVAPLMAGVLRPATVRKFSLVPFLRQDFGDESQSSLCVSLHGPRIMRKNTCKLLGSQKANLLELYQGRKH